MPSAERSAFRRRFTLGFTASGMQRLALGAVFCAGASCLVWLVERPRAAPAGGPATAAAAVRTVRLRIDSTYPVAAWTVSVLDRAMAPTGADAFHWQGEISGPAGEEVLVIGRSGSGAGDEPNRCLRLAVGDRSPVLHWGGGDLTVTAAIP